MKAQDLIGHWVHSHEEDTATEMVFRPAHFNFPRSRGRASIELQPDALIERGPGPGDAATETRGTWSVTEDGRLSLFHDAGKKVGRVLNIVSAQPDRLVVRND
jgi:hypothetical protein